MATLADELLADLMDSGSEDEGDEEHDDDFRQDGTDGFDSVAKEGVQVGDGDEEEEEVEDEEEAFRKATASKKRSAPDEEEAKARVEKMNFGGISDIRSVAVLMKTLQPVVEVSTPIPLYAARSSPFTTRIAALTSCVLQKIEYYQTPGNEAKNIGSIEDNPEYKLLTDANKLSTSIDSEIILVHKFIRDHYSVRFPELETLIQNALIYAKTVAIIGNGPLTDLKDIIASSDNLVKKPLNEVLDGPALMTVRMEATRSSGRALSETELQNILRACEMTLQLDQAKIVLTQYVQSRMNLFAPNLTVLVGSETAAKLVNTAGSLAALAKTPSCNLANMGWNHRANGLATNVGIRQKGFLYNSPILQNIPTDMKKQALRIISAKVVLAARVDQTLKTPDSSTGQRLLDDTMQRLEKLTEPPPNKGPRALPAPDDKPARKRGGRQARQAKKQFEQTDLAKAQNRMVFGKEEAEMGYGTGDSTKGMGMIGATNDGRVRVTQIDKKTAARLSKKNPGWGGATPAGGLASSIRGFGQNVGSGGASVLRAHGLRTAGVGTAVGGPGVGTSSVIAFTPVQGLELINPKAKAEAARKAAANENKWFNSGTFTQIAGASVQPPQPKVDAGGFKVPALPALKRQKKEEK
jgi:U4/U6 small nuclear ribonucleoprotein PRP31